MPIFHNLKLFGAVPITSLLKCLSEELTWPWTRALEPFLSWPCPSECPVKYVKSYLATCVLKDQSSIFQTCWTPYKIPLNHLALAKFLPIKMMTSYLWCLSVAVWDRYLFALCGASFKHKPLNSWTIWGTRAFAGGEGHGTFRSTDIEKTERLQKFSYFWRCEVEGCLLESCPAKQVTKWGFTEERRHGFAQSTKITIQQSEEQYSFLSKSASHCFCLWS